MSLNNCFFLCPTQNGPGTNFTFVPLPCQSAEGERISGTGACTMAEFVNYANGKAYYSVGDWCEVG